MKRKIIGGERVDWTFVALFSIALLAMAVLGHPLPLVAGAIGMILDAQTLLSDAQALTATAFSTNTYDTALAARNIAAGEPLCAVITVDVAADNTTGNETYQFQVVQSANADLSSPDVLVETVTAFVTAASLVAARKIFLPIPPNLKTKRYIGLQYTLGGTTPLITVTAAIIPLNFIQNEQVYAKNYTISS